VGLSLEYTKRVKNEEKWICVYWSVKAYHWSRVQLASTLLQPKLSTAISLKSRVRHKIRESSTITPYLILVTMSVTILYDHCILYMSRVRAFMCDKVVLHRGNCTRVSVSVFDRPLTPSLKSRCDHKWVI